MLSLLKKIWRIFFLPSETYYTGEFGYELISVIPYAYWLHKRGKLKKTYACKDTKCLYYFSPHHIELDCARNFCKPHAFPIKNIHVRYLDTRNWLPPPYKEIYKNSEFIGEKKFLVICNKYNEEWGGKPVTFLSKEVLETLFTLLQESYQIIYIRPLKKDVVWDSPLYEMDEHEFIRKQFPKVWVFQDIQKKHPELTFNELQLKIFANTDHFISVQGGYAIVCSYFGGTNIIYGKRNTEDLTRSAPELELNAYENWYGFFSNAKIHYAGTYEALTECVKKSFL